MIPQAGDLVRVRSRQYLVEAVQPPPEPADSTLVRLACLEAAAPGAPLELLWEREIDAQLLRDANWERIASRGFDAPHLFSAYLHSLRWNCVTATDAKLFQAPYRAGIELKAYQLEPLRMALGRPRVNLFIADDVGLGKTIEAGLILRERSMRQKVRRCVICVPPSVVRQWKDEMDERFGLSFVIYDRDYVSAVRHQRGWAVNPFKTHNRFIISQALVRDEAYASPLRDWLGEFSSGALLILDEAHNIAPASGAKYAVDSKLTRVMRDLAARFEHRIFLSATPHNGHSNSFSALLEILDPQRFCRGVPVDAKLRDEVMVRRLKSDLRSIGESFPTRNILRVVIDQLPEDAPELALSRLLQQLRVARELRLAHASKSAQAASMLVVSSLQKRLLSSIEAFARTLEVHRRSMAKLAQQAQSNDAKSSAQPSVVAPSPRSLDLLAFGTGPDDERAELDEDDVAAEEDAQMDAATRASAVGRLDQELALLEELGRIAQNHRYLPDPRVQHLLAWIREHQCPELGQEGARWNPRRLLVFTEYADTKRYLQQELENALRHSHRARERLATFHGGIGEEGREAIKAAFNADPEQHPLRILIATDAAREGVNLQNHCYDLFHFDIPWNPGRLEQRNGRIDRKLQKHHEVNCSYFVLPQRAEDRVLDVLVQKTRRIHEELGCLSPVVEQRISHALQWGISHRDAERLSQTLQNADQEQSGVRVRTLRLELGHDEADARLARLRRNLDELRELLEKSRRWIGFEEPHFRDALSASLETLGVGRLHEQDGAGRWRIPHLHERKGADPSWAATLDSLRAPRKAGQSPAEWRREAPIRPVVFSDPGNLDGEVVHLHLEHRVVQRLLGRFLSMGFRDDALSRACVLRCDEAQPMVVLLGRLSLFGERGARLHDKVLAAAAQWFEPEQREALHPLLEDEREQVLQRVEKALAQPRLMHSAEALQKRLRACAAADVAALEPLLQRKAAQLRRQAERELGKRADAEARAMSKILEEQRARIRKRQDELETTGAQRELAFDADEKRQLEADRKHWLARLDAIAEELASEPERVRASYGVKAARVEPVGLVYLWPLTG